MAKHLQEKEDALFRLAIDASPAGMIVTDAEGRILFANAESARMFDYDMSELIGKSIDLLVPRASRQNHAQLRHEFFASPSKRGMGVGRDLRALRRDGSEFPVEIGLTPIASGVDCIVLATVLDITARREAESALAHRARELERANDRLARFAYVASHDLQEPLRKIAAFAELLGQAIDDSNMDDMRRANDVIRASAIRARGLVDDLLLYSRTVNDVLSPNLLDLRQEIDAALEDLSQLIVESQAEIENLAPHVNFLADPYQFLRLIHNVVSNAIKYRKPNERPRVKVRAEPSGDHAVRVAIADNGIGFEAKYAEQVFEPFKRLHSPAKYPGSGIGLAICKSIADRHGWQLSIQSAPGEGTTFFVTIPICD